MDNLVLAPITLLIFMKHLELEKHLPPWIGKTSKLMRIFIADRFKDHGLYLTIEQFILLKMLSEKDGVMQNDLAIITERNKASLTRLVNNMEKKHLVARIPSKEDKRVNQIFLTKKGVEIFAEAERIVIKNFKKIQAGISRKEIEVAISILKRVQQNISNFNI